MYSKSSSLIAQSTAFTMAPPSSNNHQVANSRRFVLLRRLLTFFQPPDHKNIFKYCFAEPVLLEDSFPTTLIGDRSPLFQFGVVADVQYASTRMTARGVTKNTIDGRQVHEKRRRSWREALRKLKLAVQEFNKADVDFVINLGDIIEGYPPELETVNLRDFKSVMDAFKRFESRVYHVLGNHCRSLPLSTLLKAMDIQPYYSFHPAPKWRFIVLDSTELSYSLERTPEATLELLNIILSEERTPHHFHGAIGSSQMEWFRSQLDVAQAQGERVVVLSHYPLADGAARETHVLANTRQVRDVIERPGTPVVLCLAGHDHVGGSLTVPATSIRRAITYITLPAILEAPRRSNAYAVATVYSDDVIHVDGRGTVPSFVIKN